MGTTPYIEDIGVSKYKMILNLRNDFNAFAQYN